MLNSFRAVVSDIRDTAVLSEIVRNLETGNVDRVLFLLRLDDARWEPMEEAIREAYKTGGLATAAQIGTIPVAEGTIKAAFSLRSPRAERWLRDASSRLVTEVVEPQREMIRSFLTQGLAAGNNPRTMALDLVGRVNRVTKVREGGIIGLTSQQSAWVTRARAELESLDDRYLGRKLRDKRFDKAVKKAIADGKPLPAATIDNAITRMQAITEKYRGDVIARTEAITALRAGQFESIEQAINESEIERADIVKVWDDTGDARTRPEHVQAGIDYADGIPVDEPFIVDGEALMYPGDQGGSAANTIQCRCSMFTRIDFGKKLARIEGFR